MKTAQDWPYCVSGVLLFFFSIDVSLVPLHIYSAGFLGIARLLRDPLLHILPYRLSFDIAGIMNLILNIFTTILATRMLVRTFAAHMVIVILFESLSLSLISVLRAPLVEGIFISVPLGSSLCTYGTRPFFKGRGSGGGINIIGLYLTKTGKGGVGSVYLLINTVIYLFCFLTYGSQVVLYPITHSCILFFVLDRIHEDDAEPATSIITENHELEQQLILDVGRGVTA